MPFKDPLAVSNCLSLCLSRMQRSMSAKAKFVLILLLMLPFSHENSFENSMYGNYTENYVLEGFQIETLLTGGIAACFQRCLRNFQCGSVNYDNSERPLGTCELNEKKPSEIHQLIYRPGYTFVQAVIRKPVSPMFVAKNIFSKYHFKQFVRLRKGQSSILKYICISFSIIC